MDHVASGKEAVLTDAALPLLLLHRLQSEIEVSAATLAFTPEHWHSPAQRACAQRIGELRAELAAIDAVIAEAVRLASALAVTGRAG
jgi:hypothetical protein